MNISVIIPVHEFDDKISTLLSKAVETIEKQEKIDKYPEINIVFPLSIKENIVGFKDSMLRKYQDKLVFNLIENDGKTDFQSQINLAVSKIEAEYFSILEFDDEYNNTFFYNGQKYVDNYDDIDIFLSMIVEVNEKNEAVKFTNEMVWAQQFVGENGEMGYLNLKGIKQNTDFKISGSIINKNEFLNLGGLKSNIKLTFNYEFLLRALNNACKIYTIPKIGYKHLVNREGSLFDKYLNTMPMNERKFWFDTATKEANFINDRVIDISQLQNVVEKK